MAVVPKLTVAICGGAVSGLSLAAFISKHIPTDANATVKVDVYEARPQLSVEGSGIGVWKRTWELLKDLGLDDELVKRNIPAPKDGEAKNPVVFRRADLETDGFMFHEHKMPYGPIILQRRDLCEMLVEKMNGKICSIHYSKKLIKYDVPGVENQLRLHFEDGSTACADILVGADGIHSTIRRTFFSDLASSMSDETKKEQFLKCIEPRWSGTYMYRTNMGVPKEEIRKINSNHPSLKALSTIWCGKDKHGLTNDQGKAITFSLYYSIPDAQGTIREGPWTEDVDEQEVADALVGWEPAIQQMLQLQSPDVKFSRWAIHYVEPVPQSVSGNVILIGDAAHAMTPHQGVGGGQAIEDSHLLGRILAHPKTTKQSLKHALNIYQQIRLPFAQTAAQRSLLNGMMYEYNHPDYFFETGRTPTKEELVQLGKAVGQSFKWLGEGGCYDDWEKAERMLSGPQAGTEA